MSTIKNKLYYPWLIATFLSSLGWALVYWDAGGSDDLWSNIYNWSSDSVPTALDDTQLNLANGHSVITTGINAQCRGLYGPGYTVGPHTLDMYAGSLTTSTELIYPWFIGCYTDGTVNMFNGIVQCGRVYCGYGTGSNGELNIYGGSFTCAESIGIGFSTGGVGHLSLNLTAYLEWAAALYCGASGQGFVTVDNGTLYSSSTGAGLLIGSDVGGAGNFTMNSGQLNMNGEIWLAHSGQGNLVMNGGQINAVKLYIPRTFSGNGHLDLHGGIIFIDEFHMRSDGGNGTMDITGGKLVINNDRRTQILGYIKDGWITAYGDDPRAAVIVDYNETYAGKTTVKAEILDNSKAYNPNPVNTTKVNDEVWGGLLTFSAGEGAVTHHLYIGTDYQEVSDANQASVQYKGIVNEPNYIPENLDKGQWYYWRVDEFDGDTTHKGKIWSFKYTDNKPWIYHFDLRFTLGLDAENQYDIRHMASCVQGIVNRQQPQIFLTYHNWDRLWLERLVEDGGLCEDWNIRNISDYEEYLQIFGNQINGLILYDSNADTGVISTSLAATTSAGVESAIAVRKDIDSGSMYNYLHFDPCGPQLDVIIDLTGKFTGAGTIWQTNTPSTGSAKCDAYIWAKEKYLDSGQCDPTLLSYTLDLWGLKQNANLFCQLSNLDYPIMQRGFCFELSPWGTEIPNDDPTQPIGTDLNTYKSILHACNEQTDRQQMIKFCGFNNFIYKYTTDVGGSYQGWETEWEMVRLNSAYNSYMEGDALAVSYISNSSFYTWFRPELTNKRYIQSAPPGYDEMVARGLINSSDGSVPAGNYILICLGDYDQGPWTLYQAAGQLFDDNARGQVSCNWSCTPNTSDRNIAAYDYMYRNQSDKDCFIAWDSGAGYVNPSQLYGVRDPSGYPSAVEMWQEHCKKYYRLFDYSISAWLLNGFAGQLGTIDAENYAPFSPDGVGMHDTGLSTPTLIGNIPVIELTHHSEPLINNVIDYSSGVHFAQYRTILMSPNTVKEIEEAYAGSGHNHRFLDAQSYFYLMRHYLGGQNTHRAAWIDDTTPQNMKAGKTYNVSVTVRNDGWDTWSEAQNYRLAYVIMPKGRKPTGQDYNQNPRFFILGGVTVETGESYTFDTLITAPEIEGEFDLYFEMVQDLVTWFSDRNNIEWKTGIEITGAADINNDDHVDFEDFAFVAGHWLEDKNQTIILPSGDIVADWPMDDSNTPAVLFDDSNFLNHGSIASAVYVSGQNDFALSFDGSSYVHVPDSGSISVGNGDFTICAWIYPDSLAGGERAIAAKVTDTAEKEFAFSLNDSQLQLDMEKASNNGVAKSISGAISAGLWQHAAVSFEASSRLPRFYVDGSSIPLDYTSIGDPSVQVDEDLYIGMWGGSYFSKNFHGKIDEFRIYNYLLTEQEIERVYQGLSLEPRTDVECLQIPVGDLNGDCVVNMEDIKIIGDFWLVIW